MAGAGEETRAAVPAVIGESTDRAGLVAQHDNRLADEVEDPVVAGLWDLVGAADEVPRLAEDALDLSGIKFGRRVAPGRQHLRLECRRARLAVMRGIEDVDAARHAALPGKLPETEDF